jgi:hypothetical protein
VKTVIPFPGSEGMRECSLRSMPVVWSGGLAQDAPTLSWRFLLPANATSALS